jgi:hypothetical protein
MDEARLYRELVSWLRSNHPLVLAQWEGERKRLESQQGGERLLPRSTSQRSGSVVDKLDSRASVSEITRAIQRELEILGISGGTPGVTPDGTPCIHLLKQGVYSSSYEESVTLARIRDAGYRRHLKQVFG